MRVIVPNHAHGMITVVAINISSRDGNRVSSVASHVPPHHSTPLASAHIYASSLTLPTPLALSTSSSSHTTHTLFIINVITNTTHAAVIGETVVTRYSHRHSFCVDEALPPPLHSKTTLCVFRVCDACL